MTNGEKVNILVVDDLPEKLLVLETILADLGENLVFAQSGEEALRRVLDMEFAVILLDVNMPPGIDGFETAEYIRRRKRSAHTPIIFITAYADEMHTAQGYSLGAVDYILSPVVPEILRTKVGVFVDLFRMTQQVRRQADERVALAREQVARAAAEEANLRSIFLAEASTALASSLDAEATTRNLARLVVPFLADLGAVVGVDEHGRPCRTELAWTGNTAGEILAQSASLDCHDLPELLCIAVAQALASGQGASLAEVGPWITPPSSGGTPGWAFASVLVLPLAARGRTLGVLVLGLGPSGRRHGPVEQSLAEDLAGRAAIALDNARLYHNIQEGDRRKGEFLAMLAHELRNPLAPIRNSVQVMRVLGANEPLLRQARDIIDRQVTHMARLVEDLLDVSRLSRGKILLRTEPVDLVQVVRTAVEDYRSLLEGSDLSLRLEVPSGPLWVRGDPTRLTQVAGNVLNNAQKFTDPGGEVLVALRPEPDRRSATLQVRDTGIGMDREMLNRLFETFSQADRSLDRSRGGLGLGLALVKGLVELHGGDVKVVSEGLGKGTEVTICLPLEARPAAPSLNGGRPAGPEAAYRILVIEDNPDAAESMRVLLTLAGHQAEVADSGPAGVEAVRARQPDVVLCDIGLPGGMDGYEVARVLRVDPALASVYLVALTGYGQEEDQRRALAAGFDQHLTKPVDYADLRRVFAVLPVRA
jgi:signal transduction histidine kinase/DNA-binding response OmpR family regulator